MKLTYLILSVVALTKSLAVPFNSQDSLELAMPANHGENCYKSKMMAYSTFDSKIEEINKMLANTTIRSPMHINNTMNNTCGAILHTNSGYALEVRNGVIAKENCTQSIICTGKSRCKNAFACSNDGDNRDDKYQLSLINSTSANYNQVESSCNITASDSNKCFRLEKLQQPTHKSKNNAATTKLATGLASALYLYFLGVASCIHNE